MEIKETTNYKLFKFADSNRQVVAAHVQGLLKSVQKNNLLRLNPIIVDANMIVIDGQHRLEVAKKLKLPIYYIVDGNISDSDIANLNTNKKNWRPIDYINYHASKGKIEYTELKKLLKKWPGISLSGLIGLLVSNVSEGGGGGTALKSGTFKITNAEGCEAVLNEAKLFDDFSLRFDRAFLFALQQCMAAPEYDSARMQDKLMQQPGKLERRANREQYVDLLEQLFNYRSQLSLANFRITVQQRAKMASKAEREAQQKAERAERDLKKQRQKQKADQPSERKFGSLGRSVGARRASNLPAGRWRCPTARSGLRLWALDSTTKSGSGSRGCGFCGARPTSARRTDGKRAGLAPQVHSPLRRPHQKPPTDLPGEPLHRVTAVSGYSRSPTVDVVGGETGDAPH